MDEAQDLGQEARPPHKLSLTTKRCLWCNVHEFHLPAVPVCAAQIAGRRIEEDGVIIRGPEA